MDEYANPHSWLLMAAALHQQASGLYWRRAAASTITKMDGKNVVIEQFKDIDKSIFLLGGFALENAIKAFLIYENPSWISNGTLSKELRSHNLTKLQSKSTSIPYKKRYLYVLESFKIGLDSRFRYPCALTIKDTQVLQKFDGRLWQGYSILMSAYSKKLQVLLIKGWNGPHGCSRRWTFKGKLFS